MRTFTRAVSVMILIASAGAASAQPGGPGGGPGRRWGPGEGGGMPGGMGRGPVAKPVTATADFLLAHTGDLALTDAQVVRLAAISRRTEARRKALAARADSARTANRPAPGDSAGAGRDRRPGGLPPAELQQIRDQMRADVRDAISVLTADQQATAWMMIAGGGPLGGGPGGPMGPAPGRPDDADRSTP
jgi:hypothetical protein